MLWDFNSDLGLEGNTSSEFELTGIEAVVNMLKNLFRSTTNTDRFEYIPVGLDIDRLLQEPPTDAGADALYLIVINSLAFNMPQVTLDTARSSVTPNLTLGEYDVGLVLNGEFVQFSI